MQIGDEIDVDFGGINYRMCIEAKDGGVVLSHVEIMCEACNENEAGDYVTGTGRHVCPGCVNRGLIARAIHHVFTTENIGEFDVPLARAMSILEDEDADMRRSSIPYVDSIASALDMIAGMDDDELRDAMHQVLLPIMRNARL